MSESLASLRVRCDAALQRCLPATDESSRLTEAMRYAVLGGGKRLRPLLVYATGIAFGVDAVRLDPAAAAIEMIHAYSLIHDDLPAMDDDDLRRGRPTVHRAFDEATAILAGDALQALAFETIARGIESRLPAQVVLAQSRELAFASGASGMVGGQSVDLGMIGTQPDLHALTRMHGMKTGALILSATKIGALAGSPSQAGLDAIEAYGRDIGLAFQIQDDVLDETGDSRVTGKTIGADRQRGKPTFTSLLGVDEATRQARDLVSRALATVDALDGPTELLRTIAQGLIDRKA